MLDRTIVAFDIETIPDPDVGRRLSLEGEDVAVVRQMLETRLEETEGRTRFWSIMCGYCEHVTTPGTTPVRRCT